MADLASKMLTDVLAFTGRKCISCYIIVSNGRMRTLFFLTKTEGKCTKNRLSASFMDEKSGQPFLLIQHWETVDAGSSGSSLLMTTIQIEPPPPRPLGRGRQAQMDCLLVIAWITAM